MSAFAPLTRAVRFIKDNKAKMFWLWIAYQAIKGMTTMTLIWIPLFLFWRRSGGSETFFADWGKLVAALILFILSHAILMRPKIRTGLETRLGRPVFLAAYSALSLGLFGWLLFETVMAPIVSLWPPHPALHGVGFALIIFGVLSIALGAGLPNPASIFGGKAETFTDEPWALRVTRHPVLFGLFFWGLGHVLANGTLAFLIFFGSQAVFALLGAAIMDRRYRKSVEEEAWARARAVTSFFPDILSLPKGLMRTPDLARRQGVALIAFALLFALHPLVFGVSPLSSMAGG